MSIRCYCTVYNALFRYHNEIKSNPTHITLISLSDYEAYYETSLLRPGLPSTPYQYANSKIKVLFQRFNLFYGGTIVEMRTVRRRKHPIVTLLLGHKRINAVEEGFGRCASLDQFVSVGEQDVLLSQLDTVRLLKHLSTVAEGSNWHQYLKRELN